MSIMTEADARHSELRRQEQSVLTPTYEGDFVLDEPLLLECGRTLAGPTLHYAVYGRLNAARDNAVLVCHALSGSALVGAWWPEIFAPGAVLVAGARLRHLHQHAGLLLRLDRARFGGSRKRARSTARTFRWFRSATTCARRPGCWTRSAFAGCAWFWAAPSAACRPWSGPSTIRSASSARLIIGVAPLSAMGLALNHLQRQAIQHDPDWAGGHYLPQRPPRQGLALARQIAMLSYKSAPLFDERFGRNPNRNGEDPWGLDDQGGGLIGGRFDIAGYLDHQGERFIDRFDANAYLAILRTMDTWDPLHGYASPAEAFGRIRARLSFVGISSDWLFPARGGARLCRHDSRGRRPCRLPRNDQRPRPRRLSGRTGRTGAAAAMKRGTALPSGTVAVDAPKESISPVQQRLLSRSASFRAAALVRRCRP